jgi:hypothetical protein
VIGDEAPEDGTDERRHSENRAEDAAILGPFTKREELGGDGESGHEDRGGPNPLCTAKSDELGRSRRDSTKRGGEHEFRNPKDDDRSTPDDV